MHERICIELGTGGLATTAVTAFELASGARANKEHARVKTLLDALTILPLDPRAANLAADVRRNLETEGRGIGMADYLIAGISLAQEGVLLTRNLEHFGRVPGLRLGRLT